MKKFVCILASALALTVNVFAATFHPNEKSLKTFNETFAGAQNVKWYTSATYSEASFVIGDITAKAVIDHEGNLLKTIRYYNEAHLPAHIALNLKTTYAKKNVWGVTETSTKNGVAYTIVLHDSKSWYYVNADASGTLTLEKELKKS